MTTCLKNTTLDASRYEVNLSELIADERQPKFGEAENNL